MFSDLAYGLLHTVVQFVSMSLLGLSPICSGRFTKGTGYWREVRSLTNRRTNDGGRFVSDRVIALTYLRTSRKNND